MTLVYCRLRAGGLGVAAKTRKKVARQGNAGGPWSASGSCSFSAMIMYLEYTYEYLYDLFLFPHDEGGGAIQSRLQQCSSTRRLL